MTTRYIAIGRSKGYVADDDGMYEMQMSITVHEQPAEPICTGLLDAQGVPLFRIDDRAPIGFDPRRWKA